METTKPLRITSRCELIPSSPWLVDVDNATAPEHASPVAGPFPRCPMYSEHKHLAADASTRFGPRHPAPGGRIPVQRWCTSAGSAVPCVRSRLTLPLASAQNGHLVVASSS